MKDIRSQVFNALADIYFKTGATPQEMDAAIEWFQERFYGDEEYEEE